MRITDIHLHEVSLKNIEINNDKLKASLSVNKGPLYHIDSIHVYGKVKIKNFSCSITLAFLTEAYI